MHNHNNTNTTAAATNRTLSRHRFRPFSTFTTMFKNHRRNGKRRQRAPTTSALNKNGGKRKRNVKRSQDVSMFDTCTVVDQVFFLVLYSYSSTS
jgi:hypothetical protein